ncbi:MAG: methyltransferase domain-containing protein, partial [Armatimonadetes bacterium]|nr:methyltransferase domain-containing protein [Armatimonadota bacterium]
NLALIACFAGLGIGYGLRQRVVTPMITFLGMAALVLLALPPDLIGVFSLKHLSRYVLFTTLYSWTPEQPWPVVLGGLLGLLVAFSTMVFMFIPLGQILGDCFRASSNQLRDYTLNVIASLAGILFFTALSVLGTSPWLWFACGFLPLLLLLPSRRDQWIGAVLSLAIIFGAPLLLPRYPGMAAVEWSPYQKIVVWKVEARPTQTTTQTTTQTGWRLGAAGFRPDGPVMYMFDVNDTAMMWLLDMSSNALQKHPWLTRPEKIEWYDFPYHIYPAPKRVLVIGSGGGNDVAAALRHRAGQVDAVEIDPKIAQLGKRFHPERPYEDPRVTVHVQDARRYLGASHEKFDLIDFAQLDNTDYNSMSSLSNIRMDSYVYTRECFEQAYKLLKPDGVMVVNFGADEYWGRRSVRTLKDATGVIPRSFKNDLQFLFQGQENAYVLDPGGRLDRALGTDPKLAAWVKDREAHWTPDTESPDVSDDWPYWFLPQRMIPSLQLFAMIFIVVVSLLLVVFMLPGSARRVQGHFFFLGAAFMLLEVHSITRVALLLGAT